MGQVDNPKDQFIVVQVTKPEKRVEAMDSSQSESEEPSEAKSGRGRKRKSEDTPASEKKAKKGKGKKGDTTCKSLESAFIPLQARRRSQRPHFRITIQQAAAVNH